MAVLLLSLSLSLGIYSTHNSYLIFTTSRDQRKRNFFNALSNIPCMCVCFKLPWSCNANVRLDKHRHKYFLLLFFYQLPSFPRGYFSIIWLRSHCNPSYHCYQFYASFCGEPYHFDVLSEGVLWFTAWFSHFRLFIEPFLGKLFISLLSLSLF